MKNRIFNFVKASLIGKIIFVFIIGTIIFISLVALTTQYIIAKKIWPKITINNLNYTQLLLDDIDSITDTVRLNEISKSKDISIAVKNDTLFWKSFKEHELVNFDKLEKLNSTENVWAGFNNGHYVVYKIGETYIYFLLEKSDEGFSYLEEVIILINLIYFLIISYFIFRLIKYILYPVNSLIDGVKKVSKGTFDDKIETRRTDELGILIHSYNDMSHHVSNMIKSKEQLLIGVSHEMRSPLTRMKLGLEFIENEKAKNSVLDDVNDLDKMITELLETERLNSTYGGLNKQEMILNQLVNEIGLQYSDLIPGLKIDLSSNDIKIIADKERLRLLFKNLIENGIKYSENSKEPVSFAIKEGQTTINIKIEDQGEGIPEDQLEFIFEPFYRVDKSRSKESGGFGLGLHLCKNIVEAHCGGITVSSKIGKGTTFLINLPKE